MRPDEDWCRSRRVGSMPVEQRNGGLTSSQPAPGPLTSKGAGGADVRLVRDVVLLIDVAGRE